MSIAKSSHSYKGKPKPKRNNRRTDSNNNQESAKAGKSGGTIKSVTPITISTPKINMTGDYYDILGLKKGATNAEIKQAYRDLMKLFHPDTNPSDPNANKIFKLATEAYEKLTSKEHQTKSALGTNLFYREFVDKNLVIASTSSIRSLEMSKASNFETLLKCLSNEIKHLSYTNDQLLIIHSLEYLPNLPTFWIGDRLEEVKKFFDTKATKVSGLNSAVYDYKEGIEKRESDFYGATFHFGTSKEQIMQDFQKRMNRFNNYLENLKLNLWHILGQGIPVSFKTDNTEVNATIRNSAGALSSNLFKEAIILNKLERARYKLNFSVPSLFATFISRNYDANPNNIFDIYTFREQIPGWVDVCPFEYLSEEENLQEKLLNIGINISKNHLNILDFKFVNEKYYLNAPWEFALLE